MSPGATFQGAILYAVAYATELALNNAPGLQAPFYTQQMRDHLARCLEFGELEQFPRDDTRQHNMGDNARLPDSPLTTLHGVEVLQWLSTVAYVTLLMMRMTIMNMFMMIMLLELPSLLYDVMLENENDVVSECFLITYC